MAQLRLDLPKAFDFSSPDEWPRWRKRFQQFHLASGLSEDGEAKQVSTLLYCMGRDAEEVLASTHISADNHAQFDAFFKVRRFNRRTQQHGESVEQFLTALYHLVETCEYGTLRDEMLRDCIVVGIADSVLLERLQLINDLTLTLEKAKTLVRQ